MDHNPTGDNAATSVSSNTIPTNNSNTENTTIPSELTIKEPLKPDSVNQPTIQLLNERKKELEEKLKVLEENLLKIDETIKIKQAQENANKPKPKGGRKNTPKKSTPATPKSSKAGTTKNPDSAERPKRQRKKSTVLKEAEGSKSELSPSLESCKSVLNAIFRHKFSFPFNVPVDPVALNIPDYFNVIKNPMDFGTVKEKLHGGKYQDIGEFRADCELVFSNACTYNHPGSDVYIMATTIQDLFNKKMKPIEDRERKSKTGISTKQETKTETKSSPSTTRKKPTKPKSSPSSSLASAPVQTADVPMSKSEMRKLSATINSLSYKHVETIIGIIQQSMPNLSSEGEVEIDLHSLDTATLRKLEGFVSSVKKKVKSPEPSIRDIALSSSADVVPSPNLSVEEEIRVEDSSSDDSESSSGSDSSSDSSSGSESESDTESDPEEIVV